MPSISSVPSYINGRSIESQSTDLNASGFLCVRNVFTDEFFASLKADLVRAYDRFFVNVDSALYEDPTFHTFVSSLVGCPVQTCSKRDPQTSWARLYTTEVAYNPFEHFHIDLKRYAGRQFRVVVNLVDESDCRFEYRKPDGSVATMSTEANSICVIEAARLSHRVQMSSGHRLLLMMDFTTTRKRGLVGGLSFAWDVFWKNAVAGRIRTHASAHQLNPSTVNQGGRSQDLPIGHN